MKGQDKMRYAINTCDIDAIRDARDAGFDYVEVPVKEILRPGDPKSAFEDAAAKFRDAGLPVEPIEFQVSRYREEGGLYQEAMLAARMAPGDSLKVYTLGNLIHNPLALRRLYCAGITEVDSVEDVKFVFYKK